MQFVLRYNHNSTGSKSYCNTHKKTRKKTFLRDIYMG